MTRLSMILGAALAAAMLSSSAYASDEHHVDSAQIEAAKTPADHEAIAASFDAEAVSADEKAKAHESMAKTYRVGGPPKGPRSSMASHCDRLAAQYRAIAEENRQLAEGHRQMARECCSQH